MSTDIEYEIILDRALKHKLYDESYCETQSQIASQIVFCDNFLGFVSDLICVLGI